jgi:hypothetical protein
VGVEGGEGKEGITVVVAARALATVATAAAAATAATAVGGTSITTMATPMGAVGGVFTAADAVAAATAAAVTSKAKTRGGNKRSAATAAVVAKVAKARGLVPAGLEAPAPGALLQGYRCAAANAVDAATARVVRGEASLAFFTAAARRNNPPWLPRTRPRAPRMTIASPPSRRRASPVKTKKVGAGGEASEKKKAAAAVVILGRPEVIAAVRDFVASYLEPLMHVGVVGAAAGRKIADKATAKVMRKHERAKEAAGFLVKEAEAIKGLVRSYIQLEQQQHPQHPQQQGWGGTRCELC